jgi:4-hydroxybenzoate polyprenyltransferase
MSRPLPPIIRAIRPRQWLKNGFVYAPAIFSGHLLDPAAMLKVTWAALGFCAIASAGYLVNDVLDRDADRLDPIKRLRPVAAGRLSVPAALVWSLVLLIGGLALAQLAGTRVLLVAVAYGVLTQLYSLWLKLVPIVEAIVLAAGFLLRLGAGAIAIPVSISHWLVICGFLLALLLAFGKRVPDVAHPSRRTPVYPASFLNVVVPLLAGVTLVSYTLYTVAPDTVAKVGSGALLLTAPLVLFGILRYLLLLHRDGAQDPTTALLTDGTLMATVLIWAALAGAVLALAGGPGVGP